VCDVSFLTPELKTRDPFNLVQNLQCGLVEPAVGAQVGEEELLAVVHLAHARFSRSILVDVPLVVTVTFQPATEETTAMLEPDASIPTSNGCQ